MSTEIWVMPTMDCEPPKSAVSAHSNRLSRTGPDSWSASEDAIRGYVALSDEFGIVPTLFAHPEVVDHHTDLFLELIDRDVGIGLHLHPHKSNPDDLLDLGLYSKDDQRRIIGAAIEAWERALGSHPRLFRPGAWSANDNTIPVLEELGFRGGSISKPGRVKPSQAIGWAGAEPDPHRGNTEFRLIEGESDFVEVPNVCDHNRPIHSDAFDRDRGFEDLYLSAVEDEGNIHNNPYDFDREQVTRNLIHRFIEDDVEIPILMMNTHSNMDYSDPTHTAVANFQQVMETISTMSLSHDFSIRPGTVDDVVDQVLAVE